MRTALPNRLQRRSLFREVNERIREVNATFAGLSGRYAVFCECGGPDCLERVDVPAEVYEDVRSDEQRFLVASGHEQFEHDGIVAEGRTYCVVAA